MIYQQNMINRNTQIALARASVACVYECDLEIGENNALMGLRQAWYLIHGHN